MAGLDIVVASGTDMTSLEGAYVTQDIILNEWLSFPVTQYVFIGAVPNEAGKDTNSLKFNYKFTEVIPPRRKYSEQLVANDMQLAITFGGLGLLIIILGTIYGYRRYKNKKNVT